MTIVNAKNSLSHYVIHSKFCADNDNDFQFLEDHIYISEKNPKKITACYLCECW